LLPAPPVVLVVLRARRGSDANFSSFSKDNLRWRDAESPPPFCLERRLFVRMKGVPLNAQTTL
jgi:hypothetical protein